MADQSFLILIVDDDEFIQKLLKETLESEGYRIQIAESAEECYRFLGMEIPDLFILDIMLPGQDGLNLCKNLRKYKTTLYTPVLMLSSKSRVQDRISGLEVGADDYLVKPFHLDELIARVKALLRRSNRIQMVEPDVQIAKALGSTISDHTRSKKTPVSVKKSKTSSETPAQKPDPVVKSAQTKKPDKPAINQPLKKTPLKKPEPAKPLLGEEADFDTRKKFATELYQQRQYDQALQMFEELVKSNSKDQYCRKYLEVTKSSMMKQYLKALGSKDNVPIRTSDRPEDFIGLDFNTQEGFIFSRIDGITDFKGIVAISGMKPITAYGVLYNLMQSGVIKLK